MVEKLRTWAAKNIKKFNLIENITEEVEVKSKNVEIIVFTASHSCYANVVLDYLDPEREYIHHRLFR